MTVPIVRTITELRQLVADYRRERGADATVGFVPTMGYMHEGHGSLIRRSAADNGMTIVSVFVNPLQFGPNEDFERYPRDEERDLGIASAAGASLFFAPSVAEMYPSPIRTTVTVSELTERLCGASRPGHFDGVATVVSKLFHIVGPDRAYFGLKDAQQIAVIERMARDLNMPVDIVPCPTVREADGLALSSRNVYLSPEERRQALVLSRTLEQVPMWVEEGMTEAELAVRLRGKIRSQPLADIDYAEIATYPDFTAPPAGVPLRQSSKALLVALAVRFGKTRLIDNILLFPQEAR